MIGPAWIGPPFYGPSIYWNAACILSVQECNKLLDFSVDSNERPYVFQVSLSLPFLSTSPPNFIAKPIIKERKKKIKIYTPILSYMSNDNLHFIFPSIQEWKKQEKLNHFSTKCANNICKKKQLDLTREILCIWKVMLAR